MVMAKLPILSSREKKSPPINHSALSNGVLTRYRQTTQTFGTSTNFIGNNSLTVLKPHDRQQPTYWQQRMMMSRNDDVNETNSSKVKRSLVYNASPPQDSPTSLLATMKSGLLHQPVTVIKSPACNSNQSAVHTQSDRYLSKDFSHLSVNGSVGLDCERTAPSSRYSAAGSLSYPATSAEDHVSADTEESDGGEDTVNGRMPGSTTNNSAPRWNKAALRQQLTSNTSSTSSLSSQENLITRIYKTPATVATDNDRGHRSGGLVGLNNLGNTCFMNSILQCLSNTAPLLEYCLSQRYSQDLNRSSSMRGNLFKAYVDLMEELWRTNRSEASVSPLHFKTQVQKFAPRFVGFVQQDSQEFLRYLLEGLHMDVNRVTKPPKPVTPDYNAEDRLPDKEKADVYWKRYLSFDNSQVVDLFVGQLMSTLECLDCGFKSTTFDPFWDLSLPIPKKSDITILDCLKLFITKEDLDGHDRPMCARCKTRRRCSKHFLIQKFPRILVLHLKRFSGERFRSKMSVPVDFPVSNLNLIEFASPSCPQTFALYQLYAVSNHSGSVYAGHYTATCRHPYTSTWNEYNDSRVRQVSNNFAVSAEAYVLFYELKAAS